MIPQHSLDRHSALEPQAEAPMEAAPAPLVELIAGCGAGRLAVLTGAGCSTGSGIPDYRDRDGHWKHARPVLFADFVGNARTRRRYWARALHGWRHFGRAEPNGAHRALAGLEALGYVGRLITQNVDGLHGRAGSKNVLELHGSLAEVVCLNCGARYGRAAIQNELEGRNPDWARLTAAARPDGDAALPDADFSGFRVPACAGCGGLLKPDVVFFGEGVPKARVAEAYERVRQSKALLVVGSSLMVLSGLRFVREAHRLGIPVAAINIGRTRADQLLALKISAPCAGVLQALCAALAAEDLPY